MTAPGDDKDRASGQAIDWLILLSEDPEDQERRDRFEAWLRADPAHAEAWSVHARSYDILGGATAELEDKWRDAPRFERLPPASSPARAGWRRRSKRLVMAAAAACLALLVAPQAALHLRADGITSAGEVRRLALPDGSIAILAPESALQWRFDGSQRQVRLLKGEAFFDVVHDGRHPFRVLSGKAQVTVLGTAFDVKLRDGGVKASVREGLVRVENLAAASPAKAELRPGQWVEMQWNGKTERGVQQPSLTASWIKRRLMVNDRPIAEALDDLRPWFSGVIVLTDARLGARHVTGSVDPGDPAEAVKSLVEVHGGKVSRITPWLLIVS